LNVGGEPAGLNIPMRWRRSAELHSRAPLLHTPPGSDTRQQVVAAGD